VRVAFGLAHSDEKRIEGLPPARQPKLLNRLVAENADAFFLRLGARTFASDVELRSDGSAWASAFDAELLNDLFGLLRKRRLAAGLISFGAAIAYAVPPGTWRVRDENLELELTTIEGAIIQSARRRVGAGDATEVASATALDGIGADGPKFLAALGAAIAPTRAVISWQPPPNPDRARSLQVAQVVAASLVLVASAGAALLSRGIHADRVAKAAITELARFRASDSAAARVDAELRRTTDELDRVEQFESTRGRTTALLGALSEALPDSTALVSLRVDSLEVNLVALTPHAASVLPALLGVSDVVSPRIVGSVTREVQGTARVERASIRFRRDRINRSPARRVMR
jgi:Tfp pilus assembly protein PilN